MKPWAGGEERYLLDFQTAIGADIVGGHELLLHPLNFFFRDGVLPWGKQHVHGSCWGHFQCTSNLLGEVSPTGNHQEHCILTAGG